MSRASSRVLTIEAARPTSPEGLESPAEGRGEVVVVVTDTSAREADWTDPFVIDVAETWCAGESSVILADGDLTSSLLHETVGTPNVEGMSDLIRYGASTERVARPVGSRSFRFIPKGTIVADPEGLYGEPRWTDWFDRVRDSGVVLVLCLPRQVEGVSDLAERADRVLILTAEEIDAPDDDRVVVVRAEASAHSHRGAEPAGSATDVAAIGPGTPELVVPAQKTKGSSAKREAGLGKVLLLALLVVILVLVIAVSFGFVSIPGITVGLSTG